MSCRSLKSRTPQPPDPDHHVHPQPREPFRWCLPIAPPRQESVLSSQHLNMIQMPARGRGSSEERGQCINYSNLFLLNLRNNQKTFNVSGKTVYVGDLHVSLADLGNTVFSYLFDLTLCNYLSS